MRAREANDRAALVGLLSRPGTTWVDQLRRLEPAWADLGARWAERASAGDDDTTTLVAVEGGRLLGALQARTSTWEAEHFGLPVLRSLGPRVAPDAPDRAAVAERLGRALLDRVGDGLVIVEADAGDAAVALGLQRAGLLVHDTMLRFALRPESDADPAPPASGATAAADGGATLAFATEALEAGRAATPAEVEQLAEQAPAMFRSSHFHADRRLDAERCDAVYRHWVRAAFGGTWADWLVVARDDDGRVGSFVAFARRPLADADPPTLLTASFGFSVPPHDRGHTGRVTELLVRSAPADVLETQCQAHNLAQVRNLSHRGWRAVGAQLVLHGWSDGG